MKAPLKLVGICLGLSCAPLASLRAAQDEAPPKKEKPSKPGKDEAKKAQKPEQARNAEKAEKAEKRGKQGRQVEARDQRKREEAAERKDPAKEAADRGRKQAREEAAQRSRETGENAEEKPPAKGESVRPEEKEAMDELPKERPAKERAEAKGAEQGSEAEDNEDKAPERGERGRPGGDRERMERSEGREVRTPEENAERGDRDRVERPDEREATVPTENAERGEMKKDAETDPKVADEAGPRTTGDAEEPPAVAAEEEQARKATEEEQEVKEATTQLEQQVERKKLRVAEPEEAKSLINEILGAESTLSLAERRRAALEDRALANRVAERDARRVRPSRFGNRLEDDERREAVDYLTRRLRGEEVAEPQILQRRDVRDRRPEFDGRRRGDLRQPLRTSLPYYHDGRRYASYRSRSDIPAILLASAVLNRVAVSNYRDVPYLQSGRVYRDPEVATWVSRPPEEYLNDGAQVVSYKVVEDSMINRDDVLFLQGSTQFVDPRSYSVIAAIAEAMSDPSVQDHRFVVEGHASREGSYDANMELSQRRAERIVRDIVRYGVAPERLIPVGYGESEARAAADAPESLRQEDRRVVVFRLDESS